MLPLILQLDQSALIKRGSQGHSVHFIGLETGVSSIGKQNTHYNRLIFGYVIDKQLRLRYENKNASNNKDCENKNKCESSTGFQLRRRIRVHIRYN